MEGSLHHVADLQQSVRSAVEGLVGHPLRSDQLVYVATLGVQAEPTPIDRNAAWDEVEAAIAEMQQGAARAGLMPEQIDELLDAECQAVRNGRGQ
jgi:hypothetical protein